MVTGFVAFLAFLVVAEGYVIYQLINRLLVQAKIPPLEPVRVPSMSTNNEQPPKVDKRKLFSVPIQG